MNLNYNVLWFDDDAAGSYESLDFGRFETEVRSWGFVPKMELVTNPDEFMARKPWDKLDLIVVDYNLGLHEVHGEDFIKGVREQEIFTEIIFYSNSGTSALWNAIQEKRLEGVYISDRTLILEKLQSVARQSVRKVLDLNNMRGMVMAEVGDIDHLIDAILRIGIPALKPDAQSDIFDRFHENLYKQVAGNQKNLELFKADPSLEAMIKICDSNKRWANFIRLKKVHQLVSKFTGGDYEKDVLTPRNFLAHGKTEEAGGGHIFRWNNKEYKFDENESLSLRKTILGYKKEFQGILDRLSSRAA